MSNVRLPLREALSQINTPIAYKSHSLKGYAGGASDDITFSRIQDIACRVGESYSQNYFDIAYHMAKNDFKDTIKAYKLLMQKKISMDFCHYFLFYDSSYPSSLRISEQALGDLSYFFGYGLVWRSSKKEHELRIDEVDSYDKRLAYDRQYIVIKNLAAYGLYLYNHSNEYWEQVFDNKNLIDLLAESNYLEKIDAALRSAGRYGIFPVSLESSTIKNLIGQILLAVYDYHSNNLIHGDLKIQNILLFRYVDKYFIKLTDYDAVAEVDDAGYSTHNIFSFSGTKTYYAPEVNEDPYAISTVKRLNLKAIDCYALGVTLQRFLARDGNPQLLDWSNYHSDIYQQLIVPLTRRNPGERMTVDQALNAEYFGATAEERSAYFMQLRKSVKKNRLVLDGCVVKPHKIKESDCFLLQNDAIKSIYKKGEILAAYLELYEHKVSFENNLYYIARNFSIISMLKSATLDLTQAIIGLNIWNKDLENKLKNLKIIAEAESVRVAKICKDKLPVDLLKTKTATLKNNFGLFKRVENQCLETNRHHSSAMRVEYNKRFGIVPYSSRGYAKI
jgi:hypothetical protein